MQEVAAEDWLPAHGCPKRCLPSGAGHPRKFICTRTGTSVQHLDGRPAENRRLESRQQLRLHLSILVWHLNSLLLVPTGKYLMTFTEFGCIPISTAYQTSDFGWSVTRWVQIWVLISTSHTHTYPSPHSTRPSPLPQLLQQRHWDHWPESAQRAQLLPGRGHRVRPRGGAQRFPQSVPNSGLREHLPVFFLISNNPSIFPACTVFPWTGSWPVLGIWFCE